MALDRAGTAAALDGAAASVRGRCPVARAAARAAAGVSALIRWAATASVLLLLLLVLCDVVLRYVFRRPLGFADEIAGYLLAAIVFLAAASTQRAGKHINVEIVYVRIARRHPRLAPATVSVATLLVTAVLAWQAAALVWSSYTWGAESMGILHTPTWIAQLPLALGAAALALQALGEVVTKLTRPPAGPTGQG